jgi:hypothetical protein
MITVVATLLMMAITPCHADDKVVLIAAKGSGIEMISTRDIRRIFLGLKSADSEMVNKPVINLHNRKVYEQFLKNVMHMTEGAYERKLVKRVFRHGTAAIREVDRLDELNRHLSNHVGDISFIDYTELEHMPDVEIVKVLW